MSRFFWIFLILSGCAGGLGMQLPAADEVLIPEIAADGTKFFLFQRDYRRPAADPANQAPGQEAPGQTLSGNPESIDNITYRRLDEVMRITGYCREGYFELYRDSGRERFSLRGECREVATETDRQQFDQPLPLPR